MSSEKMEGAKRTKKELLLINQLQNAVQYSKEFEEKYEVNFVDKRMKDIVEDLSVSQ